MKILKGNEDMLNGTELIKKYECQIRVDKSIAPFISPPRRVPSAIRDRLQEKLNLLERGKIIEKVNGLVTSLNNRVIIEKLDEGLAIYNVFGLSTEMLTYDANKTKSNTQ